MNLAVYGNRLAVVMTSWHVDFVIKRDVYPQKMHSCSKISPVYHFFVLEISVVYQENIS